jgi:hypothetical protein
MYVVMVAYVAGSVNIVFVVIVMVVVVCSGLVGIVVVGG